MDKEPDYLLVRDMHASIRLNLQHYLRKDGLGYLLHPSIPQPKANYRIANLGAGTGIWLLDLARQVPDTTQLYGFDISDSQYPHVKYLPHDVKLEVLDNLEPEPPKELQGTFDIVHLQLWLGGPGGYIQWNEIDPLRGIAEGPNGEPSTYATKILTLQQNIKDHRWIERLPELFKQFNLENIEKVFAFEQPWQSKMAADMSCAVVNEMGNSGSPFVTEKLKNFGVSIPLAYSEVAKGARLTQPFCVTVGRKTL